jgi:DNA-binding winged helix-turn-helix (wHTH) protein
LEGLNEMEGVYQFGPFRLETKERRLLRDGRPVRLRGKVLDTLCVLVSRPGCLIEKDDLIAAVWPTPLSKRITLLTT